MVLSKSTPGYEMLQQIAISFDRFDTTETLQEDEFFAKKKN